MIFSLWSPPCKNLLLQQFFIGSAHVEQYWKFVREMLGNKNQTTSDVIGQFYCWLFLAYTPLVVSCKIFKQYGH